MCCKIFWNLREFIWERKRESVHKTKFFEFEYFLFFLVFVQLGLKPGLLDHWRTLYLLGWTLAWWLECSLMVWETWVQSQVKSYQRLKNWYLMPPCFIHSIIRYRSRVKWRNPGKGVVPSPTPWCSSYWKESHLKNLGLEGRMPIFIQNFLQDRPFRARMEAVFSEEK